MDILTQLMAGSSLAAFAGLRAWLPLLALGLLAREGYAHINPEFQILTTTPVLIVLGVLTVLEFLGDKVIAVDHFLDAVGTLLRPISGAVLASATLTGLDPTTSLVIGSLLGGSTAFTVHTGKAVTRAKASLFAPLHLGTGNIALSFTEDIVSAGGTWLVFHHPVLAFILALFLVLLALLLIVFAIRTGTKIFRFLTGRRRAPATPAP